MPNMHELASFFRRKPDKGVIQTRMTNTFDAFDTVYQSGLVDRKAIPEQPLAELIRVVSEEEME